MTRRSGSISTARPRRVPAARWATLPASRRRPVSATATTGARVLKWRARLLRPRSNKSKQHRRLVNLGFLKQEEPGRCRNDFRVHRPVQTPQRLFIRGDIAVTVFRLRAIRKIDAHVVCRLRRVAVVAWMRRAAHERPAGDIALRLRSEERR